MIKNHLKISWRHLLKNKLISLINVTGLVVGISGSLLIGLFILDELKYDQHFSNREWLYRVTSTYENNGVRYYSAQTNGNVASVLGSNYPEIRYVTRLLSADEGFLFSQATAFKENIIYTDSAFLKVFDLPILSGNKEKCLTNPASIIISETMATKLFGENWPQKSIGGETLLLDGRIPLTITAVYGDLPEHTHFSSNLFASLPTDFAGWMNDESKVYTYALMNENSSVDDLSQKLQLSSSKFSLGKEENLIEINLQPLTSIHLDSSFQDENAKLGSRKNIYALAMVGLLLIVIAGTNFANLHTASSLNRMKEVGLRKTIGAVKGQLVFQFLGETLLISVFALGIGLITVITFLPAFNQLTGKRLVPGGVINQSVLLFIACLTLGTSFLAGIYPAVYLARAKAIEALKGIHGQAPGAMRLGKALIIVQFTITVTMIILSIVAQNQVDLINNKPLGFDKENLMTLGNPYMLGATEKILDLKKELLKVTGVEDVSITGYTPAQMKWDKLSLTFPNRQEDSNYTQLASWLLVDESFISTMGLRLTAGRNFLDDHEFDKEVVIINEKAVRDFGLNANGKNPLGAELSADTGRGIQHFTVVGVIADFNFGSLHQAIRPMVMKLGYHRFEMALKLSPTYSKTATVREVELVWRKHLPEIPFEYSFIKDRYDQMHQSDFAASKLFSIFCLVAIAMSAFGLFSIVTHSVVNRTKEIGIRRLLGASEASIASMLTGQFLKLIVISYGLGIPIAWFLSNRWLADFAYRIEASWLVYAFTGLFLVFITVLTIGFQVMKAAKTNPVDNLRYS
jgi:putative ABC transport system permease protein